jgi:hypothetical protein
VTGNGNRLSIAGRAGIFRLEVAPGRSIFMAASGSKQGVKVMRQLCVTVFSLIVLMSASCGKKAADTAAFSKTNFDPSAVTAVALDGPPMMAPGIMFTPPKSWTDQGASTMRITTYAFGPVDSDKDSAILAVSYFGKEGGGPIKDNILRWIHQIQLPSGGNPEEIAVQSQITVDSMTAHLVELEGTYMSGGMMGSPAVPKEGYRLTGAVVETPEGNVFFKLTGPSKTAQKMAADFAAVLLSLKRLPAMPAGHP